VIAITPDLQSLVVALIPLLVPLFFVGYGFYVLLHAERVSEQLRGPRTRAAIILLRTIAGIGVVMGIAFLVVILVNVGPLLV
jgi:hypothetical protein